MNYKIIISGQEPLFVSESKGEDLMALMMDPDKDEMVSIDGSLYQTKKISGVVKVREAMQQDFTKMYGEEITKFRNNLSKYASQTVKQKVERELKYRVLMGLSRSQKQSLDLQSVAQELKSFFEGNPEFPYAPFSIWRKFLPFMGKSLPRFYELVIRHDQRVEEWLNERKYMGKKPNEIFDGKVGMEGGDVR